jgi:hypothetical protein
VVIWYIFSRFGILYKEKSGNPGSQTEITAFLQQKMNGEENEGFNYNRCFV